MSASSLLLNLDAPALDDPESCWEFAVLEGHNHIPNFWFSAFEQSGITTTVLEDEQYPHCVTDRCSAANNVRRRKERLLSILPPEWCAFYEKWISLIEGLQADYLHIYLIEVADMVGVEECHAECLACINSLDTGDVEALKRQYSFIGSPGYPDEVVPGMLIGYPLHCHT